MIYSAFISYGHEGDRPLARIRSELRPTASTGGAEPQCDTPTGISSPVPPLPANLRLTETLLTDLEAQLTLSILSPQEIAAPSEFALPILECSPPEHAKLSHSISVD